MQKRILLDNAHCSWAKAIKYCTDISDGKAILEYRKDFVASLHNAVELFLKQIMLDCNDYRIASVKRIDKDGEPAKSFYSAADLNGYFSALSVSEMKSFFSIEFSRIIELHKEILGNSSTVQSFKSALTLLNQLRNNETHFFVDPKSFLTEEEFRQLYNFMIDFSQLISDKGLLPTAPKIGGKKLAFSQKKLNNFSYLDKLKKSPVAYYIRNDLKRSVYIHPSMLDPVLPPANSTYQIAQYLYNELGCAFEANEAYEYNFPLSFNDVWIFVQMCHDYNLMSIETVEVEFSEYTITEDYDATLDCMVPLSEPVIFPAHTATGDYLEFNI